MDETHPRTVGVVGLGLMGGAIADLCLEAGFDVVVFDASPGAVDRFRSERGEAARLTAAESLDGFGECDLIVEAIAESLDAKLALLGELDRIAPDAVVASNTSTFMPSELAPGLARPERLVICHFFNPPHLVPLVEIVPGPRSDGDAVAIVQRFATRLGKRPVLLEREAPGFVANRLQAAVLREAYALVESGVASAETIDEVVRTSLAPRWAACGPIRTADLGGLDVFAALTARLFPELDAGRGAPPALQRHVERGELGAKSGAGVYPWTPERRADDTARIAAFFRLSEQLDVGGRDEASRGDAGREA